MARTNIPPPPPAQSAITTLVEGIGAYRRQINALLRSMDYATSQLPAEYQEPFDTAMWQLFDTLNGSKQMTSRPNTRSIFASIFRGMLDASRVPTSLRESFLPQKLMSNPRHSMSSL